MAKGIIAVDFGGVMSIHDRGAGHEHVKTEINMPHCIESLRHLAQHNDLVLVSFCGYNRALETKKAVDTTIPGVFKRLIFVKDKTKKGLVCAAIGAGFMIDDSDRVLSFVKRPCQPVLFTKPEDWLRIKTLVAPVLLGGDERSIESYLHRV